MDLTSISFWLWVLVGLVAGIAVGCLIGAWIRSYMRKRAAATKARLEKEERDRIENEKFEAIREWDSKMRAAGEDFDKIVACGSPPDGAREYYDQDRFRVYSQLYTTFKAYECVCVWPIKRDELLKDLEGDDVFRGLEALNTVNDGTFPYVPSATFVFGEDADHDFLQAKYDEKLAQLVVAILEAEPKSARQLFKQAQQRRNNTRNGISRMWMRVNGNYNEPLAFRPPDEWNDLVAMFLPQPKLSDFSPSVRQMPVADVMQLALQAVEERSLTKAKLALAYAGHEKQEPGTRYHRGQNWFPYRVMLGDDLTVQLGRLVKELHKEQGLFVPAESKK